MGGVGRVDGVVVDETVASEARLTAAAVATWAAVSGVEVTIGDASLMASRAGSLQEVVESEWLAIEEISVEDSIGPIDDVYGMTS